MIDITHDEFRKILSMGKSKFSDKEVSRVVSVFNFILFYLYFFVRFVTLLKWETLEKERLTTLLYPEKLEELNFM